MTGGLPRGLIANTDTISHDIEGVGCVQPEELAHLWRVYSTNRALLRDDVGDRLQNLFWRIWSNPNINRSTSGHTVARLFTTFSNGGDRVRTTPVPSPRPTSPTSHHGQSTPTPSTPQVRVTPVTPVNEDQSDLTAFPPVLPAIQSPLPPPILKNPLPGPSNRVTTDPVLSPGLDDMASGSRKDSTSSNAVTLSPSPPEAADKSPGKGGKMRTSFIANTSSRPKTKPAVVRRKSSQGSASTNTDQKKPPKAPQRKSTRDPPPGRAQNRARTQRHEESGKAPTPMPPGLPSIDPISSFALPSASSWQEVDSPTNSPVTSSQASMPPKPSSWLVDRNFRGKFVETQIKAASSTNLVGMNRSGSTVRFIDELSSKDTAPLDPKALRGSHDSLGDDKRSEVKGHRKGDSTDSQAVVDDDEEADSISPLPRTKSQLSVMIDHERRVSGSLEIGPSPLKHETTPGRVKRKEKTTGADESSSEDGEEGLVTMGRRDGVTKAGGNTGQLHKRPQARPPMYEYRSPTPPIF